MDTKQASSYFSSLSKSSQGNLSLQRADANTIYRNIESDYLKIYDTLQLKS